MEKFNKLDEEKQKKIIHAALLEFAEKGYDQASTNQIVKNAGIGKGMLFYYFNSKQELYHYLIEYSFNALLDNYLNLITGDHEDFVDHLKQLTKIKLNYLTKFPEVNQFLGRFVLVEGPEIPEEIRQRYEEVVALGNEKVYGNKQMNQAHLRDDVDPEKAFKLIEWSIKGYQNDLLHKFKGKNLNEIDFIPLWNEFDEYLAVLKTCFYKKEGE